MIGPGGGSHSAARFLWVSCLHPGHPALPIGKVEQKRDRQGLLQSVYILIRASYRPATDGERRCRLFHRHFEIED
jgi:hypothetical protein